MRAFKAVVLAALAIVSVTAPGCRTEKSSVDVTRDPVAVVMMPQGPKSELVVVDLERFRVVKRIGLRSLSISLDGDPVSRTVVTAQAGQPHDHDSACGIVDLSTGRVTYVDTKLLNPSDVAVVDGKAYIVHGLQENGRLLTSVVDIANRKLVGRGGVSDRAGEIAAALGAPLVPVSARSATEAWTAARGGLQRLDAKGKAHWIARLPFRSVTVLGERGDRIVVVGSIERPGKVDWAITTVDPVTGAADDIVPLSHVTKGIVRGSVGAGEIYLCDENGLDPADPGKSVIVLDAQTLAEKRRFEVPGSPADADPWDGKVVVSDGITGELLLYERGGSTPIKRVKIAKRPLMAADTIIFSGAGVITARR